MQFYKIESPTTEQIFNAILEGEYTPIEKIAPKANQIKVLLSNEFGRGELLVTFSGVTNSGGFPIFLSSNASLNEVAAENNEEFYELSEEEQDHEVELLSQYLTTYDQIFNL